MSLFKRRGIGLLVFGDDLRGWNCNGINKSMKKIFLFLAFFSPAFIQAEVTGIVSFPQGSEGDVQIKDHGHFGGRTLVGSGIQISTTPTQIILTSSGTGSGTASYYYQLLDVSTAGIAVDYQPCFNGSSWIMIPIGGSCAFSVASFSDSLSATQEIGTGVWKSSGSIHFTASYSNGPPISSTITFSGWVSSLPLSSPFTSTTSVRSVNYPSVTGTVVFTITAKKSATATNTITHTFNNDRYWGINTISSGTYSSADIRNLSGGSSDLTNSVETSFTVSPGGGQYMVYAYPSRLGTANFTCGGFLGGFNPAVTSSVTNSSGYTETYAVYSSVNANLGTTTCVVTTP